MNKTMLMAICMLAAIVIASSFGLQFAPNDAIQIPQSAMDMALYICPAASSGWINAANAIRPLAHYITMAFFFAVILLMFFWGWALYQNLLADSFKRDAFTKIWAFTKFTFWAGMIAILVIYTPNHFRTVHVNGVAGEWVLCENNTPGAVAVRASALRI